MARADTRKWEFKARFRRNAFGWRSQPAIQRVKEAVREIKGVARKEPVLAADGAVAFLERVSPAIERVDSSSGSIGTAVNKAIAELVPIIAAAPVDAATRSAWLERLWGAHAEDEIPYIERLADHWGELCASEDLASVWADRLLESTRRALGPDPALRAYFHGTGACLSALHHAGRHDEILEVLSGDRIIWAYKRWAVQALAAMGRTWEAIEFAESCRGSWTPEGDVDELCEEILLSCGLVAEAYERYATRTGRRGTYLATFRAVVKKYPHEEPAKILADLVSSTPGDEGKWFAAAKDAGLHDEAIALASRTPCDPRTLTRAARDHAEKRPAFAVQAGLLALYWIAQGHGHEISSLDVRAAYSSTMKAAERTANASDVREEVKRIVGAHPGGFAAGVLARELAS